jgi:Zn-dependent M28 family amino/carboxypeptidase
VTARAVISAAELARLADLGGAGHAAVERNLDERARPAVDLGVAIHLQYDAAFEYRESANVVGVVRGRDLPNEYVVYTAHLDHLSLGKNPKLSGDSIFNGAVDNASGVATMIAIATAFARQPARRSIVFVATTGEEAGLLGGYAFVANAPVPRAAIVANLNLDDIPGFHPLHDVVPLGLAMTSLAPLVQATARSLGLAVSPDPEPEQGYFGRGDNFPFAEAGIPALRLHPGAADAHGDLAAGRALHKQFVAKRYHTPADEWSPNDDYQAMADFARFGFELGRAIADVDERPTMIRK